MKRVSTLTLHRYRLGELSPEEAAQVRAALDANPADAARLRAQEAFRQEFVLRPVPVALQIQERPSWWAIWRLPAVALALATTLLFLLPHPQEGLEITRLKGVEPRVDVLVEGQGLLDAGELLRPGDRVQLRLPAGPYVEAWVSDGEVVLGRFDTWKDRPTLAPFSLTLDEAPGDEQVVLLLSRRKLSGAEATAALQGRELAGVEELTLRLPKVR